MGILTRGKHASMEGKLSLYRMETPLAARLCTELRVTKRPQFLRAVPIFGGRSLVKYKKTHIVPVLGYNVTYLLTVS